MKEIGKTGKCLAKVNISGMMEEYIKENFLMIKKMGMEYLLGEMRINNILEIG